MKITENTESQIHVKKGNRLPENLDVFGDELSIVWHDAVTAHNTSNITAAGNVMKLGH